MNPSDRSDDGFLSRWSRRKVAQRDGEVSGPLTPPVAGATAAPSAPTRPIEPPSTPVDSAVPPQEGPPEAAAVAEPEPLPDIESLTPASDFTRFVQPDVDTATRNAALKKLFADPRFNVIDEMDIDIMDYGKLEVLPPSMLRMMTQSKLLGLFRDEEEAPPPTAEATALEPAADTSLPPPPAPPETEASDEDPDLRLQPVDATGHPGDRPGPEEDPGRQR